MNDRCFLGAKCKMPFSATALGWDCYVCEEEVCQLSQTKSNNIFLKKI